MLGSAHNNYIVCISRSGFPGGTSHREPACQCRICWWQGFYPWVRKISWTRARQSLDCLGNPMAILAMPGESHGPEEPGGLWSTGSQRVRHNWSQLSTHTYLDHSRTLLGTEFFHSSFHGGWEYLRTSHSSFIVLFFSDDPRSQNHEQ